MYTLLYICKKENIMETTFTHIIPSWEKEIQIKENGVFTPKPVQKIDKTSINSMSENKTNTHIKMDVNKSTHDVTSMFFWENYFNNNKNTLL